MNRLICRESTPRKHFSYVVGNICAEGAGKIDKVIERTMEMEIKIQWKHALFILWSHTK